MKTSPYRHYWPITGWREASPQEHGMDLSVLAKLDTYVAAVPPRIRAILVVRHGYLVFERYYLGNTKSNYQMIRSVTKSVTSALVGIALQQGYIRSLDQTLSDFFPQYFTARTDLCKKEITLRHLLTLTHGFLPDHVVERMYPQKPASYLETALEEAMMLAPPGQLFAYSSIGVELLSILLAQLTHMSLINFAKEHLFEPLGISTDERAGFVWETDNQGYYHGSGGLHLLPRDMAKFGFLYLNNGYWEGKQLIPADYVKSSTQPQSTGGSPECARYGYLWWVTEQQGHRAFFAAGRGGQYIYVIPDLDIVITISSTVGEGPGMHHKDYILPLFILPAISR
jgi:CubicO group peptidase (beta-lactamase class C family)